MRQCKVGKQPVWKCYHTKTTRYFPFIISFKKLVNAVAIEKVIEDSDFTEQVFYSNESKAEFNKLMKSVSVSGFILHIGEK